MPLDNSQVYDIIEPMERFNDRNEYVKYLKAKFKNLEEEYNVFTHIITIFSYDHWGYNKTELEILDSKTFGILREGLSLCLNPSFRYSSMNATTVFIGNTKDLDVNDIVDYTYDQRHVQLRRVMVFAIPKYININGTKVEFSSYKGAVSLQSCETPEIKSEIELGYIRNNLSCSYGSLHHTKFSLLDCTLSSYIPKEYILGCQQVDLDKAEYSFLDNETHVSHLTSEQRTAFDQTKVDRILELGYHVEEDNRLELFAKRTKIDCDSLDALYYDEI